MHTVCKTNETKNFRKEVKEKGLRFRLDETRVSSLRSKLRFTRLQAYDIAFAYRLSRKEEWLVTPKKISGETPEFAFELGVINSESSISAMKYSLYNFGKERFYMAPSTKEEKSVFFGKKMYRTGYVTRNCGLYVNPVDFFSMSGMNCQRYDELRKENADRPVLVMRLKISETERFIEFYRDDKKKKLNTWFENRYVKCNGDIDIEFRAEPVKYTTFALPKVFTDVCNLSGEHYLPTEYDEKTGKYRIECPVSVCSCCGKVIKWDGSHKHEVGLACSKCAEAIPVLHSYMSAFKSSKLPTGKRLEKAIDAILADVKTNEEFLATLCSETTALKRMISAAKSITKEE